MSTLKASTEKLIAHLKTKGKDRSWPQLRDLYAPDKKDDWARGIARMSGFDTRINAFTPEEKIAKYQFNITESKHKKDNEYLVKQIIHLKKEIEVYKDFEGYVPKLAEIPSPKDMHRGEATAIFQWSDWHLDEEVLPSTVDGLNKFNPTIAAERCALLFKNGVKLADTQRGSIDVPYAVIQLGGDFITNYIHPEGQQTNTMGPMQAIEFAADQICSGIEYNLKHGRFKHITFILNRGNHGRITQRMQSNDYQVNLETVLYSMVKREFKKESKISWIINDGALSYYKVYDHQLRFFHGHQIRFKGGIGGLTIPLYKAIHRWNANRKAFYNFMCDKHSYQNATPDSQINGSLVGFNAYALEIGCEYQPPLQSFTLLDSKRGITIKAPIFCEK